MGHVKSRFVVRAVLTGPVDYACRVQAVSSQGAAWSLCSNQGEEAMTEHEMRVEYLILQAKWLTEYMESDEDA